MPRGVTAAAAILIIVQRNLDSSPTVGARRHAHAVPPADRRDDTAAGCLHKVCLEAPQRVRRQVRDAHRHKQRDECVSPCCERHVRECALLPGLAPDIGCLHTTVQLSHHCMLDKLKAS
jgi:hypothetical protein